MKRHSRPFTVEVKSRRKHPQSPDIRTLAIVEEPAPGDVGRKSAESGPSPASQADGRSGVFAMADTMFASLTGFGAPRSSPPGPEQVAPTAAQPDSAAADRPRRVLPSLLSADPFASREEPGRPSPRDGSHVLTAKPAAGGKRQSKRRREVVLSTPATESRALAPAEVDPSPAAAGPPLSRPVRRAQRWTRSVAALPRSEKWKRRLPPVCR